MGYILHLKVSFVSSNTSFSLCIILALLSCFQTVKFYTPEHHQKICELHLGWHLDYGNTLFCKAQRDCAVLVWHQLCTSTCHAISKFGSQHLPSHPMGVLGQALQSFKPFFMHPHKAFDVVHITRQKCFHWHHITPYADDMTLIEATTSC